MNGVTFKIYDEDKNREEIIKFVKKYHQSLLTTKSQRIHAIMSFIPPNTKVLDFGCGWDVNAIEMVKKEIW